MEQTYDALANGYLLVLAFALASSGIAFHAAKAAKNPTKKKAPDTEPMTCCPKSEIMRERPVVLTSPDTEDIGGSLGFAYVDVGTYEMLQKAGVDTTYFVPYAGDKDEDDGEGRTFEG